MRKMYVVGLAVVAALGLIIAANTVGVQDGNTKVQPINQDQSARLIAGWGTWVQGSAADSANITVRTYWRFLNDSSATLIPTLNGIINNSGSTIAMKLITEEGDTLPAYHLPAYGYSGLMPNIRFIFNTGSSDSVMYCIRWN